MAHIEHFAIACESCDVVVQEISIPNDDTMGRSDTNWREADRHRPQRPCQWCGGRLRTIRMGTSPA